MSDVKKVTDAKPKITGAIRYAKYGTALPTDAKAELPDGWLTLGYISEDGYTNSNNAETASVKEWGGSNVLDGETSKNDTFKYTLIEALNENVQKFTYGEKNVIVAETGEMTVHANNREHEAVSLVIDEVLRGGRKMRTVAANALLTGLDDIVHKKGSPIGYPVTVTAYPDEKHKVVDENGDTYLDTHVTYYSA